MEGEEQFPSPDLLCCFSHFLFRFFQSLFQFLFNFFFVFIQLHLAVPFVFQDRHTTIEHFGNQYKKFRSTPVYILLRRVIGEQTGG